MTISIRESQAASVIYTGTAVFACIFIMLSLLDHFGLRTQINDLGFADQALWQLKSGDWTLPLPHDERVGSALEVHSAFALFLIAPLYLLFPSPVTLLVLGSIAISLTSILVYRLALKLDTSPLAAVVFGMAVILNPMVHELAIYDFKILALALPLIPATLLLAEHKRWLGFWIALVTLLSVREEAAAVGIGIAIFVTLRHSRKHGLAAMLVGVSYWLTIWSVFPNLLEGQRAVGIWDRYAYLGVAPEALPIKTITQLGFGLGSEAQRCFYLLYLFLQGWWLAWFAPLLQIAAVPQLFANLADRWGFMCRITGVFHSALPIVVQYCAALYGYLWLKKRFRLLATAGLGLFALQAVIFGVFLTPLPYGAFSSTRDFGMRASYASLSKLLESIPPDASVGTQNNLAPHISHRKLFTTDPGRFPAMDYVILGAVDPTYRDNGLFLRDPGLLIFGYSGLTNLPELYEEVFLKPLFADERFGVFLYDPPFYLFKRGFVRTLNEEANRAAQEDLKRFGDWYRGNRHELKGWALGQHLVRKMN